MQECVNQLFCPRKCTLFSIVDCTAHVQSRGGLLHISAIAQACPKKCRYADMQRSADVCSERKKLTCTSMAPCGPSRHAIGHRPTPTFHQEMLVKACNVYKKAFLAPHIISLRKAFIVPGYNVLMYQYGSKSEYQATEISSPSSASTQDFDTSGTSCGCTYL